MNKLKTVILTIALLSSMPVNADEASSASAAADTPSTFSRMDALTFSAAGPLEDGSSFTETYPGPSVKRALEAHTTFYEIATVVAAATLIKYSWQLGEKIGEVISSFTCKKKCKKA